MPCHVMSCIQHTCCWRNIEIYSTGEHFNVYTRVLLSWMFSDPDFLLIDQFLYLLPTKALAKVWTKSVVVFCSNVPKWNWKHPTLFHMRFLFCTLRSFWFLTFVFNASTLEVIVSGWVLLGTTSFFSSKLWKTLMILASYASGANLFTVIYINNPCNPEAYQKTDP